jgi:hypothetical protein
MPAAQPSSLVQDCAAWHWPPARQTSPDAQQAPPQTVPAQVTQEPLSSVCPAGQLSALRALVVPGALFAQLISAVTIRTSHTHCRARRIHPSPVPVDTRKRTDATAAMCMLQASLPAALETGP